MARVVVVGSINVDLVGRAAHLPAPGETVLGHEFAQFAGGKAANQAVAAVRAGAPTALIARVGGDDFGEQQHRHLTTEGVDVTHVEKGEHERTGVALITVADGGENAIVVVPGANGNLDLQQVHRAVAAGVLRGAAVMLAQLEVPLEVVTGAFEAARRAGVRTILNPAPAQALPPELLALCDVVVCNEIEERMLRPDLDAAAEVVVTVGAHGVRWRDGSLPAYAVDVVDTVGAGDAFCGVLAAALALGYPLGDAIARANAGGALACTKVGAQTALPTAAEIDTLMAR